MDNKSRPFSSGRPVASGRLARWLLLLGFFAGAALLLNFDDVAAEESDDQAAPMAEVEDPFGASPFELLEQSENRERDIPFGQNPDTSEMQPEARAIPLDEDVEPPSEPVALRFRFEESMHFDINNTSRMGFDERPDLRQIYRSGMAVEYTPISETQRAILPHWQMAVGGAEEREARGQAILATISRFTGTFDSPSELTDSARTHQILKDAAFSYRITDRGEVSDLRIHPPTNPLARSSIEDVIRLLAVSHPVFPEEALEPGASWTHEFALSVEDRGVVKTQDVELRFSFERWSRCGAGYCAVIEVEQDVRAAGRMIIDHHETSSATVGSGTGWILFDHQRGQIVRSRWELDAQGNTAARRRVGDTVEELAHARFNLSVQTQVAILGRDDRTHDVVPIEND